MPAPITIVIPTLNAADTLPATLGALVEGLHAGLIRELIVSDGGSTDQTLEIADEVGAEIMSGSASRGGQLRRGCAEAKGEWLLILHADTVLQDGWTKPVAEHLRSGAPAVFRLASGTNGFASRWGAIRANLRSRWFGLPRGDQGLLVPLLAYRKAGGFPDQPLKEDIALIRRLPKVTLLDCRAVTRAG